MTDWLADWLTDWLTDRPMEWMWDWLTDWLLEWLAAWLADWLTGQMINRSMPLDDFGDVADLHSPTSSLSHTWLSIISRVSNHQLSTCSSAGISRFLAVSLLSETSSVESSLNFGPHSASAILESFVPFGGKVGAGDTPLFTCAR